jgi:cytochrome c5
MDVLLNFLRGFPMSFHKLFIFLSLSLVLMVGFMNCSDMKSARNAQLASLGGESLGADGVILSAVASQGLSVDKDLEFYTDDSLFDEPIVDLLWDHDLNGTGSCTQSASSRETGIVLNCAEGGTLNLYLTVEYESGDQETFFASVNVAEEFIDDNPQPPPPPPVVDPGAGSGGPTVNGAQLYTTHCQSCHGLGATTNKRGRTAQQIQTAINLNVGGMGALSNLTPAEVQAIADYLN